MTPFSPSLLSRNPFSPARRLQREAAERVYAACAAAARRPALFAQFAVPDTLQGRFEMLTLHLFLVLDRLMHDPGDDPALATGVSEIFVAEMDDAFRGMGVGDVKVPKRVQTLYRSFAGRFAAYRTALQAGGDALEAALARNVYPDDEAGGAAASLAAYVQAAAARLRTLPLADLRSGAIGFPALPDGAAGPQ